MRIISGKFRRRNLVSPPAKVNTRPIPDRVKESVFSILRGHFEGARVVDAFAGTGSIGLEAISRGAAHCIFLERDKRAADILERNIKLLGCEEQCTLVRGDALGTAVFTRIGALGGVDLVFFDPPYPLVRDGAPGGGWERVKSQLGRCIEHLSDSGFAVLRTPCPFRHLDEPEQAEGPGEEDGRRGKGRGGKRRRDELDERDMEHQWIGSEIDVEEIQRQTRELEQRLNERDEERGRRGAGGRDIDAGSVASGGKRHLTLADLNDDDLDDEGAGGRGGDVHAPDEWGNEHDDDAAQPVSDEHGPIAYHDADLSIPGAQGPETHRYGSTAVHLYMRRKA